MITKKYEFYLSIGYINGHKETFDLNFDPSMTEEEIEEEVEQLYWDWANNYLDAGFKEVQ